MARQFDIVINDEIYSGHTAPAKDQVEMLHIAARTSIIVSLKADVSDQALITQITFASPSDVKQLVDLCINKGNIVRNKDNIPVAENLFQDEIHNFYLLLGKALRENIGNFWKLSQSDQ